MVDLWFGWADAERTRAWRRDTLVNVFSVGKASRGAVRADAGLPRPAGPRRADRALLARVRGGGQGAGPPREVLGHRAGLAAITRDLPEGSLYDWDTVTSALAAQRPWWTPGTAHGYHVHTFGFLAGELVRRAAGVSIGSFLRSEIAARIGADLSFGLARGDRARRAEYVFNFERAAGAGRASGWAVDPHLLERAYLNPPGATGVGTVNSIAWQDAELPSANLHADARGIARVYDALVRGAPALLDADTLCAALTETSAGADLVLGRPSRFGLGFQLTQPERPMGANPESFGHFGAGGSVGFGDPRAGVAFAYVTNHGGPGWQDPRNRALIDSVYDALGAGG